MLLLLLVLFVLFFSTVGAESTYVIDFTSDPPLPQPGQEATLRFTLENAEGNAITSHLFLRISQGDIDLFSGTLDDDSLHFAFPKEGTYTLTAEYGSPTAPITSSLFELQVGSVATWSHVVLGSLMLLGIVYMLFDIYRVMKETPKI